MPITELERQQRRQGIGSSDMAAILGLDPWRSAEDVRLEKLGRLIDKPASDAMNAGTWLEGGVLAYAAEQLGEIDTHPGTKAVDGSPIVVNTDGLVLASGEPVEAKTAKLFGPSAEWWGDEGTDQVPDRVIVQAHCHILAWGQPVCHVPVLIGGRGFAMFTIPRSPKICDIIRERAEHFWQKNVLGDTPVEGSNASLEVVKRLKHEPEKVGLVDPALIRAWIDAKEAEKIAKDAHDTAQAAVLAALGDAEAAMCGDMGAITYLMQSRKEHTVKASAFRVLRYKPKGI
jgi:putative phage-type endonuclease